MQQLVDREIERSGELPNVLEAQPRTTFRACDSRAAHARLRRKVALTERVIHPPRTKVWDGNPPRCAFRHLLATLLVYVGPL